MITLRIADCGLRKERSLRIEPIEPSHSAFRTRKGQWFLIGGLILAMLLSYVAATRGQITLGQDTRLERDFTFSNLKSATRATLSGIVTGNTSRENIETRLLDLEYVLKNFAAERASNISGFILLGVPQDGYVNATLLNFFRQNLAATNISVGSASVYAGDVNDETVTTFYLPESAGYFLVNMTYTVDNGSGPEKESVAFNTTRKAFFIFKLALARRSGTQVMQDVVYG